MATERGMSMTVDVGMNAGTEREGDSAERKRQFWLGWVVSFAAVGLASGATALAVSFLTACTVMHESRRLSIAVSSMLVGCLASLLLASHGMDRLAVLRRESER